MVGTQASCEVAPFCIPAARSNSPCPDQAAQCHPQTDALDPQNAPVTDKDREAAAERVRQGTAADHAGALELFKPPPVGGHES